MSNDPNERQVGGLHYKDTVYEHWDFVCDTDQHYLIGCTTKYISRHKDKNGKQDLEKAIHYLEKATHRGVKVDQHNLEHREKWIEFCKEQHHLEYVVLIMIYEGDYETAIETINYIIEKQYNTL